MLKSLLCLLFIVSTAPAFSPVDACAKNNGAFDIPETRVTSSPAAVESLPLDPSRKVLDFDVAKDRPRVAILVRDTTGTCSIVFWNLNSPGTTTSWPVAKGFSPTYVIARLDIRFPAFPREKWIAPPDARPD
jgi:hypothetical protein